MRSLSLILTLFAATVVWPAEPVPTPTPPMPAPLPLKADALRTQALARVAELDAKAKDRKAKIEALLKEDEAEAAERKAVADAAKALGSAAPPAPEVIGIGKPGPPGHSPVLTWVGDQIAIDGKVTGPHLTGPQGPAGPPGPQPITDPFAKAIADAWALESAADKAHLKDLARLYAQAAVKPTGTVYIAGNDTAKKIVGVLHAARVAMMQEALPNVREVLKKQLDTDLVMPENKPLDDAARDKIANAFLNVATHLAELK